MSLPPFTKIIEGENQNFESSRKNFEDILSWGERIKELLHIKSVKEPPGPLVYFQLVHLAGNSFTNAMLLTMKGYIFHGLAVGRLGIEAFNQMCIIEIDYENHLRVWENYNYTRSNDAKFGKYKKDFTHIFRRQRATFDYSKFMEESERDELVHRWDMLNSAGSHVSFRQTVYSFSIEESEDRLEVFSGIFDIDLSDKFSLGKHLIWLIDTFLIAAQIINRILEFHSVQLFLNTNKIKLLWNEWLDFKAKKVGEYGIEKPTTD